MTRPPDQPDHPDRQFGHPERCGPPVGDLDTVLLPFHLADTDQVDEGDTVGVLAAVSVLVPPELLTAILAQCTTPGQIPAADRAARWEVITRKVLAAGIAHWATLTPVIQGAAQRDPDVFVWWENCRQQVRHLFPDDPDTPPDRG